MSELIYKFKAVKTPVGLLKLIANQQGLSAILWEHDDPKRVCLQPEMLDEQDLILKERVLPHIQPKLAMNF